MSSDLATHLGKVHQGVGLVAQLPLLHLDTSQSVGKSRNSHSLRVHVGISPASRLHTHIGSSGFGTQHGDLEHG